LSFSRKSSASIWAFEKVGRGLDIEQLTSGHRCEKWAINRGPMPRVSLLSRFRGLTLGFALLVTTVAAVNIGSVTPAAASKGSWRQIRVTFVCSPQYVGTTCDITIKPVWDDWNKCVDDNYTRGSQITLGDNRNKTIILGVTTKCFLESSRMHWRVENVRQWSHVELHVGTTGQLTAACGGTSTGGYDPCSKSTGFDQLRVEVG
jgi:hypothetical protein